MIRLIVIDDDPDLLDALCEYLEFNSFNVIGKGSNGKEAVDLYREMNPDIVITDHSMPQYDGNYAIERIRQIDSDSKIIVITGHDTFSSNFSLKHTPNEILKKPIDFKQLIKNIHSLTEAKNEPDKHEIFLEKKLQII